MLQGLRELVNALSRGALVHDIAHPIALTAIQVEKEPRCESDDRARLLSTERNKTTALDLD